MAIGIPSGFIEHSWSKISPLIESVFTRFPRAGWSIDDVRFALEDRDMQLWADNLEDTKLIAITRIVKHPQATECWVWLGSGETDENLMSHLQDIEDWAQHIGCNSVVLQGRMGWLKKLKGWGEPQILIRKNLEQEYDSKIH